MMIQMDNERRNAIGLDLDLELIWRWLKWNQEKEMEEMAKRSWKTMFFNFAWPCEKFAQSCEMLKEDENGADELSTLHNCTKLLELMRNCIFSKFLGEEAFEKPLRWCQVSTWLWFINRNLIYSFCGEIYFLIVELFRFFLYRIFYFPSFSY